MAVISVWTLSKSANKKNIVLLYLGFHKNVVGNPCLKNNDSLLWDDGLIIYDDGGEAAYIYDWVVEGPRTDEHQVSLTGNGPTEVTMVRNNADEEKDACFRT